MKTYKAILLSVAGLIVVVTGAYLYMKGKPTPKEAVIKARTAFLEGEVVRVFEGENKVMYSLDIPETATSTIGMDGALIKVVDATSTPFISMYFSYEGGRGYTASDYVRNVIAPRVPGVSVIGTTTVGLYTWVVAQSSVSEWHVAQVGDGQWLLIVESKKAIHDTVVETLDSLTTK